MTIDTSEPFARMVATIQDNSFRPFGGAAVIVGPGTLPPIEVFQVGTSDEGQFWATLITTIQIRLKKIEEQQQVGRAFGIR